MTLKRMVVAVDPGGQLRAIGPVYNDDSIEKILEQIEGAGWTALPSAALCQSVTGLRAELKHVAAAGKED